MLALSEASIIEKNKLSTDGNYDYAPLNALAGFVTDTEPPSDIRAAAAELGVDIIKTTYTGDPKSMARVVEACPARVAIQGGG